MADEVRLVRTKYSTSTVFNFYCALSQEIFYYFKIMFPEQENNIFEHSHKVSFEEMSLSPLIIFSACKMILFNGHFGPMFLSESHIVRFF